MENNGISTLLHLVFPSSCAATKTSAMSKILQNLNSNKCKSWNMLLLGYSHGYWQPKFGIFMSTEKSHNASTWLYSNDFPHWQQQQQQQQQQSVGKLFKSYCFLRKMLKIFDMQRGRRPSFITFDSNFWFCLSQNHLSMETWDLRIFNVRIQKS